MRFSTKDIYKKFNHMRKQNWSAPTIMSVFIAICMICIFSLESIGLLNKSANLNYRLSPNEHLLVKIKDNRKVKNEEFDKKVVELLTSSKIKSNLFESKVSNIQNLLYEAAMNQLLYEDDASSSNALSASAKIEESDSFSYSAAYEREANEAGVKLSFDDI